MGNSLHSEYCNCECPAGNSYAKLEETLNRVRRLHTMQTRDGVSWCITCLDPDVFDNFAEWPCDTMKALAGDDWEKISEVVRYLDNGA
jgi:hypothetical protein